MGEEVEEGEGRKTQNGRVHKAFERRRCEKETLTKTGRRAIEEGAETDGRLY